MEEILNVYAERIKLQKYSHYDQMAYFMSLKNEDLKVAISEATQYCYSQVEPLLNRHFQRIVKELLNQANEILQRDIEELEKAHKFEDIYKYVRIKTEPIKGLGLTFYYDVA